MPVVSFKTKDDSIVEGLPVLSSFMRLNSFSRQQKVMVYYQEDNPKIFIITSEPELEAHW